MMRDSVKDQKYFKLKLAEERASLAMFEQALKDVIASRGEKDKGVQNGYSIIADSYQKIINIMYSLGSDLNEISHEYNSLLPYFCKIWNIDSGYMKLIKILSLGVLFSIDSMKIKQLKEKILAENVNDFLVGFLLKYLDTSWTSSGNNFVFHGIYNDLKIIIDEKNPTKQLQKIEVYLKSKWYELHKDCSWYDTHNTETYVGYWSFEAGAVVKILRLDDTELKGVKYYPYDLVHYH